MALSGPFTVSVKGASYQQGNAHEEDATQQR